MAAAAWQGMLKEVIAPLPQSDAVQDKKNSLSARESVQCVTFLWAAESGTNNIWTCISDRGHHNWWYACCDLKKL